jgi:hypothetical protein
MGLRNSPYRSLQWQVRLKFELYGEWKDTSNLFHWNRVEFNLPGSRGYRSDLPWVMKIREDGHLAVEIFVYVDVHLEGGWGIRFGLLNAGDPGCLKEADVAHGDARAMGWHCHAH